jgi:hypothetical protein
MVSTQSRLWRRWFAGGSCCAFIFSFTVRYLRLDGETIRKWVCALLIYGVISLILTVLVMEEVLYVPIDVMVSVWSYAFFVFNPVPMLYWWLLILVHGPSVWVDSGTMNVIHFVYPLTIIVISAIILLYQSGVFYRSKK